jgi:hypothetical protein
VTVAHLRRDDRLPGLQYNLAARVHKIWKPTSETSWAVGAALLLAHDAKDNRNGFEFDSEPGDLPDNVFVGRRRGVAIDTRWSRASFELTGEWMHVDFEPLDQLPAAQISANNWHLSGSCFLRPAQLQIVVSRRSSGVSGGSLKRTRRRWIAGINWWPRQRNTKVMLNYVTPEASGPQGARGRWLARAQFQF